MHWIVPLLLVFGFLAGFAPHDRSFGILLPVLAYAALVPFVAAMVKGRQHAPLIVAGGAVAVMTFAVSPTFAPVVVGVGASAFLLASRFGQRLGTQLAVAGLAGIMTALVVEPAGLALGLWSYAEPGLYYGFPPVAMLTWFCATAAVVAGTLRIRLAEEVPVTSAQSTIALLAFATGACVAAGLWPPALLGLLLLMFGFHVLHYV
ncbi:carotenoid biosynthesis protein [Candidatus Uhrbacteria bacterium]|nr:carotenoid biosynthesis protein [Candidatus Uhrbacteria bacterium]